MGKAVKVAAFAGFLWLYGKVNRIIGYANGTIDTLENTEAKTYEGSFGDVKIKLTKIEKEA